MSPKVRRLVQLTSWYNRVFHHQLGSRHGPQGYMILFLAVSLSAIDIIAFFRRAIAFVRNGDKFSIRSFWKVVFQQHAQPTGSGPEYTGLNVEDPEEYEEAKLEASPRTSEILDRSSQQISHDSTNPAQWASEVHHHHRQFSQSASDATAFVQPPPSDDTLHDSEPIHRHYNKRLLHQLSSIAFCVLERSLVFAGLHQLLTGVVVYTGMRLLCGLLNISSVLYRRLSGQLYQRLLSTFDQ